MRHNASNSCKLKLPHTNTQEGESIMPHTDYISKLFDMGSINILDLNSDDKTIVVAFRLQRRPHVCPSCGGITDKVHDYRNQQVKDIPAFGRKLIWLYSKRRYCCPCCNKRFYETNGLLPKFHRLTSRLTAYCLNELKRKCSQKDIADSLGISSSTVHRWLQLVGCHKPIKLPKVLSIDEFRGNTDRGKFQCILTSPVDKKVIDILPTRDSTDIFEYLRQFPNRKEVQYFITDMCKPYVQTAKHLFPQATIVIDRFHVVRYCTWALENVRKRVQKKLLPEQRKYFKRSRKLLLAHMEKLSEENKAAVERMLLFSRDLREAYLLKEVFYRFMASKDKEGAIKQLKEFRIHAHVADIPEFKPCLTMLQNWEPYILNAFTCPYSNGFTEGINNTIKVIKRIAYGYRNFDNFRRRILHTLHVNKEPITF